MTHLLPRRCGTWQVAGAELPASSMQFPTIIWPTRCPGCTVSCQNLGREWGDGAEAGSCTGSCFGVRVGVRCNGAYVKWHNPFAYFSDVVNSSTQRARIVPISQLSADTANNTLPNFSLIVPDNNHNAHDCPTSSTCTDFDKKHAADLFLQQYLPALINTPEFQKDGVLVIWWDEGSSGDTAHGGGHVEVNLLGPQVKKAYRSGTFRQHQHVLRTITDLMGLAAPGAAANVSGMSDVFTTSSTTPTPCSTPATTPAIHICSPAAGSTVTSPVTISATARWDGETVTLMKAYVDGVATCSSASKNLSCTSTVAAGTHGLTVNTWNSTGALIQAKSSFAVQ